MNRCFTGRGRMILTVRLLWLSASPLGHARQESADDYKQSISVRHRTHDGSEGAIIRWLELSRETLAPLDLRGGPTLDLPLVGRVILTSSAHCSASTLVPRQRPTF